MLSLNDDRWSQLKGGRRTPCDPRPLLARLEWGNLERGELQHDDDLKAVWHALWDELHHQGDVDEASYASIPHLVRIYRQRGVVNWNAYAIVAAIELARGEGNNPELPNWLRDGYFEAIRDLAEMGMKELPDVQDQHALRGILCIIALEKGARTYARFLLEYSEQELLDLESAASEI
jgi:hypothetical protein